MRAGVNPSLGAGSVRRPGNRGHPSTLCIYSTSVHFKTYIPPYTQVRSGLLQADRAMAILCAASNLKAIKPVCFTARSSPSLCRAMSSLGRSGDGELARRLEAVVAAGLQLAGRPELESPRVRSTSGPLEASQAGAPQVPRSVSDATRRASDDDPALIMPRRATAPPLSRGVYRPSEIEDGFKCNVLLGALSAACKMYHDLEIGPPWRHAVKMGVVQPSSYLCAAA